MVDGERRTIFSGLSFAIEPGEIVDLVGPSGAGKSSLLTAFARLNPRASGDLRLDGRSADDFTPQQWRAQVAYLPQKPVLLGETVAGDSPAVHACHTPVGENEAGAAQDLPHRCVAGRQNP